MRTSLSAVVLAGLAATVCGEAVTLTEKNFDKKVFGKKNKGAFIKFLAPW